MRGYRRARHGVPRSPYRGGLALSLDRRGLYERPPEQSHRLGRCDHRGRRQQLTGEIKRWTDVFGILPNEATTTRLAVAILMKQSDEGAVIRYVIRHLNPLCP